MNLMAIIKAAAVLQRSYCRFSRRSAFNNHKLWYRTHWVRYLAHAPEKKELAELEKVHAVNAEYLSSQRSTRNYSPDQESKQIFSKSKL